MAGVAVLVTSSSGSRVVRIPLDTTPGTAQQLQARLEQVCGLSPGSIERFEFQGQTLSGQEDLRKAGISTGVSSTISSSNRGGSGSGADEALYPNAWFASPLTKAYQRPLDLSWPPVRHADFVTGFTWILAALAALVATSRLPLC